LLRAMIGNREIAYRDKPRARSHTS
jgi:hypothetical protein